MIQDLKLDSQRWQAEKDRDQRGHGGGGSPYLRDTKVSRHPDANLVAYQDSRTHASRQHYGPSEGYASSTKASSYATPSYGASEQTTHYTTASTPAYTTTPQHGYQAPPSYTAHTAQPRTDPYANYQSTGRADHPAYTAATPQYSYPSQPQPQTDPYGRATTTTQHSGYAPRYFGYFDERFLVYR